MVDGINRTGSSFGSYGYGYSNNSNVEKNETETNSTVVSDHAETQVDPAKVMEFLANNNVFIKASSATEVSELDSATKDRIVNYMELFETIYGVLVETFGEAFAQTFMNDDNMMDALMGMIN